MDKFVPFSVSKGNTSNSSSSGGGGNLGMKRKRDTASSSAPRSRPGSPAPAAKKEVDLGVKPAFDMAKYSRGEPVNTKKVADLKTKSLLKRKEKEAKEAATAAARAEMLLTADTGYLEAEGPMERTYRFKQTDIAAVADVGVARRATDLRLETYGPYSGRYSRSGRHMILAGAKGHLAIVDWNTLKLTTEFHVREDVHDAVFLHNQTLFAVAQKKYAYIYDSGGVEVHCLRGHVEPLSLEFLPYHFLLASGGHTGYLKYQDVSTGALVAEHRTRMGPLRVIRQNPWNAVICAGHAGGAVTQWTPNMSTPVMKLLAHRGAVTALAVDAGGSYMVTAGADARIKVWDLRKLSDEPLANYFSALPARALDVSQTGLVAVGYGSHVQIWGRDFVPAASRGDASSSSSSGAGSSSKRRNTGRGGGGASIEKVTANFLASHEEDEGEGDDDDDGDEVYDGGVGSSLRESGEAELLLAAAGSKALSSAASSSSSIASLKSILEGKGNSSAASSSAASSAKKSIGKGAAASKHVVFEGEDDEDEGEDAVEQKARNGSQTKPKNSSSASSNSSKILVGRDDEDDNEEEDDEDDADERGPRNSSSNSSSNSGSGFIQRPGRGGIKAKSPYMRHELPGRAIQTLHFRPFDDFLAIGHSQGLTTIIAPGAGEANVDSRVADPFQTRAARKEGEVHALLEKLPPSTITPDPGVIGTLDRAAPQVRAREAREAEAKKVEEAREASRVMAAAAAAPGAPKRRRGLSKSQRRRLKNSSNVITEQRAARKEKLMEAKVAAREEAHTAAAAALQEGAGGGKEAVGEMSRGGGSSASASALNRFYQKKDVRGV